VRSRRGEPVELFRGVRMLRAGNRSPMTLDGTRTFLLGNAGPVVIDPGPDDEAHLAALLRALQGRPAAILLTHTHGDHAGAAAALARATGAPIFLGRGAPRMPLPEGEVAHWLEHGEGIECEAGSLEAIATPGHAPEHFAFLLTADGTRHLFVGDLFLGVGDTTLVSQPHGSVSDYLRSLEVVSDLRPARMYPAHGPALRDPPGAIARYRAHRLERIEEVLQARRSEPDADEEVLVERIYGADLDPRLRRAAAGSVRAMMAYLDGRTEDAWRTH
jgi:glyoxylase-like metal-dependent hydrolase (beta-lactamase superfamily II)